MVLPMITFQLNTHTEQITTFYRETLADASIMHSYDAISATSNTCDAR